MLHVATMPLPFALRMRALHPLVEGDGSCTLLYDLERAAVVEVPEDLQFHIAPALETGDLDEALLGWLVGEDLLTGEGGADWIGEMGGAGPLEISVWWRPSAIYRIDGELHARLDQVRKEEVLEIVELVFKQSCGTSRVKLHLNWDGSYPGDGLLERIVVESSRLAGRLHLDLAFQLTLAAGEVTPSRADFLAGSLFQVRLLCGSYPASLPADPRAKRLAWQAESVVRLLLDRLGDRLTVHCVLDEGRLLDLWEWAKRLGVHHLDATIVEDSVIGDGVAQPGRRREIRNDLLALCDEMADELGAQRVPIDYKPLTRIVDRLMRSEPRSCSEQGSLASLVAMADSYPRSFLTSFGPRPLADLQGGAAAETRPAAIAAVEIEPPCHGCWARYACGHSSYVVSTQDGEEAHEISEDACAHWRTEVEVALRFYHRLAHTDPLQVRRFFDDSSREPALAPGLREDPGLPRMPF